MEELENEEEWYEMLPSKHDVAIRLAVVWSHAQNLSKVKPIKISQHLRRQLFDLIEWQKINKGSDMEEWGGCVGEGFLVKGEEVVGYARCNQNTLYTSV